MENLLHILKLIKQTKCEKQAKLPSTLQSRYIQIHTYTHTHTNKLNTQAHAEMQTHTEQHVRRGAGAGRYTYTYTHTYSLINTVITSCGGQSAAAGTGR